MGRNFDKWVEMESNKDCEMIYGLSLRSENYKGKMLRLTFGEQYLLFPPHSYAYLFEVMGKGSIKGGIMEFYRKEASEVLGRSLKEIPVYQVVDREDPDMQTLESYIGQKIYDEGPYAVLGRVMRCCYEKDEDALVHPGELLSFANPKRIGEVQ